MTRLLHIQFFNVETSRLRPQPQQLRSEYARGVGVHKLQEALLALSEPEVRRGFDPESVTIHHFIQPREAGVKQVTGLSSQAELLKFASTYGNCVVEKAEPAS